MAEKKMNKYLIQTASKATTKGGKGYVRLQLYDTSGRQWPGIFWEDRDLEAGKVVDCLVEETEYNGQAQLTVHALRVLDEKATDEFLPKTSASVEGLYTELQVFVNQVTQPQLKLLLAKAIADPRWKRAPAAKTLHHAFLGGLLEHIVNLCRLAHAVCALYPRVNRDLVVTGCVLHDIGKMDEMACTTVIEYTIDGELLGHIIIGLLRIDSWMEELQFTEELRRQVRHLVISHHGQLAYGSPKTPMTLEASVLVKLDGLDAELGAIFGVLDKTPADKVWTEKVKYESRYYLGEGKK